MKTNLPLSIFILFGIIVFQGCDQSESSFQPSLSILTPSDGDTLTKGEVYHIKWESNGLEGPLKIFLKGGSNSAESITIADYTANDGHFSFTIPEDLVMDEAIIYIEDFENKIKVASKLFTLLPMPPLALTVLNPNGGEVWIRDETYTINWTSRGLTGPLKILLKGGTGPGGLFTITNSTENDGQFSYRVPENLGYVDFKVIIRTLDDAVEDSSDNFFSIPFQSPKLTVLYPNGGEVLERGKTYDIKWESRDLDDRVNIFFRGGNTSGGWFPIAIGTENDGQFTYTIPENLGYTDFRVYIRNVDNTVEDRSDGYFFIPFGNVVEETIIENDYFSTNAIINMIFDELQITLNSGPGEGQIIFGEFANLFGLDNMYIDIPDKVVQEWYTAGAKIHLYVNDINLRKNEEEAGYEIRWTEEKGGSLKLSLFFEEEGREILGTWHGDIWDFRIDVYFIPLVDAFHNLHWLTEANVEFEEEIDGIPESWFVDFDDMKNGLEKTIQYSLSNNSDEIVTTVLSLSGQIVSNKRARCESVDINNDRAVFTFERLDTEREMKELLVKFDHIHVHDDEDYWAAGELYFKGSLNHNTTEWSGEYSANSGATIYLTGGQWTRAIEVANDQPINIQFEGYDDDVTTTESLGDVNLTFQPPTWNVKPQLQSVTSSNGGFTLYYWILSPETPPGQKRLAVKFDRIDVLDDEDNSGSGELFFKGTVNELSTGWSGQYDRDSHTKIFLGGGGRWQKTLYLSEEEALDISFTGYDEDVWSDDQLGTINKSFTRSSNWGVGCRRYISSKNGYWLNFRIVDLDEEPDIPNTNQFLVTFTKITVHDDNDNTASGEIFVYGSVNCDYTSLSEQMDLDSGGHRYLHGGNWFKRVRVPKNTGAISVFFSGYDEDETTIETLGDIFMVHSVGDDWGQEQTYTIQSSNQKMTLEYTIDKVN